ncbi:MAG: TonB-dependent receptor [Bacteroidetes bacterium]|nr:TonB-dependent receptor [Bacteroidota bacterium]
MIRWQAIVLILIPGFSLAQTAEPDTARALTEITVHAYLYNRKLKETPVALGLVGEKELNRFNVTSVLPAMNTVPGVRMEERSPGSYRFSIRGSSLRSPFGIRNVKFYWNGLPLTDGGGNTYLNLLDFDSFGKAEIIKGPGGSLYGAGSGGVVLLSSPQINKNRLQFSSTLGSYGLQRYQVSSAFGNARKKFFFNYAHQQASGYRQQSALRRDAFNLQSNFVLKNQSTLQASVFYTDLYYQTPGGLTQTQYANTPQEARQPSPSGTPKGAVQQQASISNKTIYSGLYYEKQWTPQWSTRAGVYGSYTDYTNPSIFNYERRTETNWGGRTDTQYEFEKKIKGKLTFGAEYQYFHSPLTDYGNQLGVKDTVQTDDRLTSQAAILFSQIELQLPSRFFLTVGGSANFLKYDFNRVAGTPLGSQQRNFSPVISPRLALLKKINESFSLFTSLSKGFSTPTWAEVLPSTGVYNNQLSPEVGINYEIGVRGNFLKDFSFDLVTYDFELDHAIVSQNGGDYFINSGGTSQKGAEIYFSWQKNFMAADVSYLKLWTSCTFTNYKFTNYVYNGSDYSGQRLPGTAPKTIVGGLDINFLKKLYGNFTSTYVSEIPLTNGNTTTAADYFLAGARLGFKGQIGTKTQFEFFSGVNNVLNQQYSLGNDLNAVAGRYYNAAAPRNFYVGLKIVPEL